MGKKRLRLRQYARDEQLNNDSSNGQRSKKAKQSTSRGVNEPANFDDVDDESRAWLEIERQQNSSRSSKSISSSSKQSYSRDIDNSNSDGDSSSDDEEEEELHLEGQVETEEIETFTFEFHDMKSSYDEGITILLKPLIPNPTAAYEIASSIVSQGISLIHRNTFVLFV